MKNIPPENKPSEETEFVRAQFFADRWKLNRATIYEWAKDGKIPHIKVGATIRFPKQEVIAAVEGKS